MKYEKIIFEILRDEKKLSDWRIQRDYAINMNALYNAEIITRAMNKAMELRAKIPEILEKYKLSEEVDILDIDHIEKKIKYYEELNSDKATV
ncbi:MAG: hypothetical protein J7K83_02125, partial [Candidatus Aenigmarchaeota archaeon]|nr:hypothetical protein [Candidatus Aenigmarchaeota archaeon]